MKPQTQSVLSIEDQIMVMEFASTLGELIAILEDLRKLVGDDVPLGRIIFNDCNCDDLPCDHLNGTEPGMQINLAIVNKSNEITESDARRPDNQAMIKPAKDHSYFVTLN